MKNITFEIEISPYDDLPTSKSASFLADIIEENIIETLSENGIDSDVNVRLISED